MMNYLLVTVHVVGVKGQRLLLLIFFFISTAAQAATYQTDLRRTT